MIGADRPGDKYRFGAASLVLVGSPLVAQIGVIWLAMAAPRHGFRRIVQVAARSCWWSWRVAGLGATPSWSRRQSLSWP